SRRASPQMAPSPLVSSTNDCYTKFRMSSSRKIAEKPPEKLPIPESQFQPPLSCDPKCESLSDALKSLNLVSQTIAHTEIFQKEHFRSGILEHFQGILEFLQNFDCEFKNENKEVGSGNVSGTLNSAEIIDQNKTDNSLDLC